MHAEWGSISADAAAAVNRTRARGGRVIAGGTTALRLLESAAAADGTVKQFEGDTDLFILPGYRFKVVRQLLTNFHLPKSTLFMLVCAFAGTARMKAAVTPWLLSTAFTPMAMHACSTYRMPRDRN